MQHTFTPKSAIAEESENADSNSSANHIIGDVILERLSRRDLMSGTMAVSAVAMTTSPAVLFAAGSDASRSTNTTPSFNTLELSAGADERHHVAEGYDADILIRWGDPVLPDAPPFAPGKADPEAQQRQFGYNNDFLGYLPLDGKSDHGLLVINHEYTDPEIIHEGVPAYAGTKEAWDAITKAQVDAEMMAQGGSVIEIKRIDGKWSVVPNSRYARRITAETDMRISGPAAVHDKLKTAADPTGTRVKGMINNCAGAMTTWGTWLTCEESFNYYFWGKGQINKAKDTAALKRYGIPAPVYKWAKFHARFDIIKEPNEVNRFGWVVEIDPIDPVSTPVKRTALGRFKHEAAGNVVNRDGRFVVYQGDDQKFDHVYHFVTKNAVDHDNAAANKDILDEGTLCVARFNSDGSGAWLPLVHGNGPLLAASGFHDQGDVVVHARMAADLLGATKMDRPEDIEANPRTGKVYVILTNNDKRTQESTDAANPRANNKFGHIIELTPDGGDHAAPTFRWEILVRCGDPSKADVNATFNPLTSQNSWFGMPDNCAFDSMGRLWIATDGNSPKKTGRNDGIWAMETSGKLRGTSKLFFRVPIGAEMCGPMFTPDTQTLFVAVQHPGEGSRDEPSTFESPTTRWPDFKPDVPPRPSVIAITRKGGGKIGV
jgi:secreted PhoX family phosphatase